MDKREFCRRLDRAGERARSTAQEYVTENLPVHLTYSLPRFDDPSGSRGPAGTIKFLGGRFLKPEELERVSAARAADLLWVDGRVPAWINVGVIELDSTATIIRLWCSHDIVPADENNLGRDLPMAVDESDPIEPFRIRGPAVPAGWRSVKLDGRISLLRESG